jgi:hypothetical protein
VLDQQVPQALKELQVMAVSKARKVQRDQLARQVSMGWTDKEEPQAVLAQQVFKAQQAQAPQAILVLREQRVLRIMAESFLSLVE